MNREARKANLKKLQLPGSTKPSKNARETRSSSAKATISNYFASPAVKDNRSCTQEPDDLRNTNSPIQDSDVDQNILNKETNSVSTEKRPAPTNSRALRNKRTKLNAFLHNQDKVSVNSPETEKPKNSEEFETPRKKIKKAPKLKDTKKTLKVLKKQPKIKSAFLRNEQIFSEITAQHCAADNFNPDEVQLALALSKSEVERVANYNDEVIVDLITDDATDSKNLESNETIRTRLQRYGFRTAPREDYSKIAAALVPGAYRRSKSKWANKFTALTLRNTEIQEKKLNDKIKALLKLQVKPKPLCQDDMCTKEYLLVSNNLRKLQVPTDNKIVRKEDSNLYAQIENYFVKKLFDISYLNAGHLLKDWNAIQGRDLTPRAKNSQNKIIEKALYKAYNDLEKYLTNLEQSNLKHNKSNDINKASTTATHSQDVELPAEMTIEVENCKGAESMIQNLQALTYRIMPPDNLPSLEDLSNAVSITTDLCSSRDEMKVIINAENIIKSTQPSIILQTPVMNNLISSIISSNSEVDVEICEDPIIEKISTPIHLEIPENRISSFTTQPCTSPIKEPPKKKLKQIQNIISPDKNKSATQQLIKTLDKISNTQLCREKSPDLFADSDEDFDQENKCEDDELVVDQNKSKESSHGITVYEIFSSDEVKTTDIEANESSSKAPLIDLTANADDIPEISPHKLSPLHSPLADHNKLTALHFTLRDSILIDSGEIKEPNKSICNKKSLSASFAKQVDKSNHNVSDVYDVNEVVFNELVNKYLRPEGNKVKKRQSVSLTQLPIVNKSFNLNETTTNGNIHSNEDHCNELSKLKRNVKSESQSFKKSLSFTMNPIDDMCIDLTQNSDEDDDHESVDNISATEEVDEDNECLILSDDEINYSIWQADRTVNFINDDFAPLETEDFSLNSSSDQELNQNLSQNIDVKEFAEPDNQHEFSILDIVTDESSDKQYKESSTFECETEPILEQFLKTTLPTNTLNINDRSRERAEFGIMDSYSEPFTQSPLKTPTKSAFDTKQLLSDASFLQSPGENLVAIKRYSSTGTNKFSELLKKMQEEGKSKTDDFDEFDKLVYGTPKKTDSSISEPSGMNELLTAKLNFSIETNGDEVKISNLEENVTEEVHVNSKVYSVRLINTPKPDFLQLTEAELLKQLYNFGIKPLKRKQAIKMLEYIYNQTHPLIMDEVSQLEKTDSTNVCNENDKLTNKQKQTAVTITQNTLEERQEELFTQIGASSKIILQDSTGSNLLRFSQKLFAELEDEVYILQTNVTKKTQQPLLPFHIAWFNLVCANPTLHEAILMFQPIDLQDVYLFLKNLGYRYDPKDLKIFFDRRCIIFRYDLTAAAGKPTSGSNRHVRKPKSKNKHNSKS